MLHVANNQRRREPSFSARIAVLSVLGMGCICLAPRVVRAQPTGGGDAPAAAPDATPGAAPDAAPAAAAPEAAPPPAAEPPPPAAPAAPPPPNPKAFSAGAWIRMGARLQNPSTPNKLDDGFMDQLYLIASFKGEATDWLKWQINLNANVPPTPANGAAPPAYASVGVQDLIVKIEPHPLINLWAGRMLVAVDRANLSGPWFLNYYLYQGFFGNRPGAPIGLKTGANGRDNGATLWGTVAGGHFKYYLGAFNLDSRVTETKPLLTGRVNIDFLDPEPAYYHQSAYHGDKDILSIAGGFQFQKQGSVRVVTPAMGMTPAVLDVGDLSVIEADALLDKKLGDAGVVTADASAYFYDSRQPVRKFFAFGAGYVLPFAVGPGRFAPAVRYQFTQEQKLSQVDGYLQYLVKSHFAKFFLGFFHTDLGGGVTNNAVQLGAQLIKM
jgi:hypothetical protein